MTQFSLPTLVATVDNGATLSDKFNNAIAALYSNHEGASPPPNPVDGMLWADNVNQSNAAAPSIALKFFENGSWYRLGEISLTSALFTTSGGVSKAGDSMLGPLTFPVGSAANPSIRFTGALATGFYSGGANSIRVSINGNERGKWDGSGLDVFDTITITGTGAGTTFRMNKASGGLSNRILGMAGGTRRWAVDIGDDAAEGGADSGSNFKIYPHGDGGGAKMPAFQISRLHQIWFWSGSWSTGVHLAAGSSGWSAMSDERQKDIAGPVTGGLTAINAIRPIRYRFKTEPATAPLRVGLSAQSVQTHIPEAVAVREDNVGTAQMDAGILMLTITDIIPHMIAAIQELAAEVEKLKARP